MKERNTNAKQTVLIAGATSGIGKSCAYLFAEKGYQVILTARRQELGEDIARDILEQGGEAAFIQSDFTDPKCINSLFEKIRSSYSTLDCFVNSAATEGPLHGLLETSTEEWQQVIQLNLTGAFLSTQSAAQLMREGEHGTIVHVASVNGVRASPFMFPYTVSKHGLIGLTRAAAADLAPYHIRVNVICPGVVKTPMHDRLKEIAGKEAFDHWLNTRTALRRPAEADEVAKAIYWMASDSSSYMTGSVVNLDGGMDVI